MKSKVVSLSILFSCSVFAGRYINIDDLNTKINECEKTINCSYEIEETGPGEYTVLLENKEIRMREKYSVTPKLLLENCARRLQVQQPQMQYPAYSSNNSSNQKPVEQVQQQQQAQQMDYKSLEKLRKIQAGCIKEQ